MTAETVDHVPKLLFADHSRLDRGSTGGHLIDSADVHLTILDERQRARDWGSGHYQQVRRPLGFGRQQQALRNAEPVLFVDHRETEILVYDLLLEDRMGSDENVDRAVGQTHQHAVACPALFPSGQDRDADTDTVELT